MIVGFSIALHANTPSHTGADNPRSACRRIDKYRRPCTVMRKLVHQAQTGALKPLAVCEAAPPSAASLDLLVIDEGEDVKLEEDVAARRHVARELAHQVEQPYKRHGSSPRLVPHSLLGPRALRVDLEARLVRLADGAQREMDEREAIVELKLLGRLLRAERAPSGSARNAAAPPLPPRTSKWTRLSGGYAISQPKSTELTCSHRNGRG